MHTTPVHACPHATPGLATQPPDARLTPPTPPRRRRCAPRASALDSLPSHPLLSSTHRCPAPPARGSIVTARLLPPCSDAQQRVVRHADMAAALPGPHVVPAERLPALVRGEDVTRDALRAADALLGSSLLLGLHPDQALDPILRLAGALRKPFAVVPCCVYARDFPQRRLRGGAAVRSYEQLLQWVAQWPGVRRSELPFSGRNVVLYGNGADFAGHCGPAAAEA